MEGKSKGKSSVTTFVYNFSEKSYQYDLEMCLRVLYPKQNKTCFNYRFLSLKRKQFANQFHFKKGTELMNYINIHVTVI